jgi:hypothetical protein
MGAPREMKGRQRVKIGLTLMRREEGASLEGIEGGKECAGVS